MTAILIGIIVGLLFYYTNKNDRKSDKNNDKATKSNLENGDAKSAEYMDLSKPDPVKTIFQEIGRITRNVLTCIGAARKKYLDNLEMQKKNDQKRQAEAQRLARKQKIKDDSFEPAVRFMKLYYEKPKPKTEEEKKEDLAKRAVNRLFLQAFFDKKTRIIQNRIVIEIDDEYSEIEKVTDANAEAYEIVEANLPKSNGYTFAIELNQDFFQNLRISKKFKISCEDDVDLNFELPKEWVVPFVKGMNAYIGKNYPLKT